MQYIKRRIRVILNNLLDLASSLIELKTLKSVLLVREAEVKLRFPYLTTFLMTLKVALQLSILYMLLNALCFEHGLLKYLNKDMVFKIYLVFATARYLYYLIGIMDSLICLLRGSECVTGKIAETLEHAEKTKDIKIDLEDPK